MFNVDYQIKIKPLNTHEFNHYFDLRKH